MKKIIFVVAAMLATMCVSAENATNAAAESANRIIPNVTELNFGSVAIGESKTLNLTVEYNAVGFYEGYHLENNTTGFAVKRDGMLTPEDEWSFSGTFMYFVTFTPTEEMSGEVTNNLLIDADNLDDLEDPFEVTIVLKAYVPTCETTYGTDVQAACESFTWIDGNTYTESNNEAQFTLENAGGCDSIVTLNLTINQPAETTFYATICKGETYSENNFREAESGTYTQKDLKTVTGCDSTVVLNLIVIEVEISEIAGSVSPECGAIGEIYSVDGSPIYDYEWTVPTGATIVSGQNTNQISVDFGENVSGAITVKAADQSIGCSETKSLDIATKDCVPTSLENASQMGIFAENGRIFGAENLQIFTVSGIEVTAQNGNLNGIYIVRIDEKMAKIVVK